MTLKITLLAASFVILSSVVLLMPRPSFGSVEVDSEYTATSTAASSLYGAFTSGRLLRTGSGALGSLVITGVTTGIVNFYNATTTDISQRAANRATSTILLASFPASVATGTYTIDARYTDGLYVDIIGTAPTSTITFR